MKYKWINKTNSNKLIIFFNGWGMDDFIISNLQPENFDVIIFYDYNDLNIDINLSEYKEKHIVAWSMGVMIATLFDFNNIVSATALCGTPFPINNTYGIPEKIYNLTINGFNEKSLSKFMHRMFIEKPDTDKYSNRTLENQKKELIKMLEYKPNNNFHYTKAIIADSDIIIPTKNQQNYWETTNTRTEIIHSGHCPFDLYSRWSEIIG